MRTFDKFLFSKIARSVILPISVINIICISLWFFISLFVDYQGIYTKLPFSESIEFQTTVFILIAIFEIIMISIITYRFVNDSSNISLDISDLINRGENNKIEFKSSARWDYSENKINKELEYVIAKTISAFLNTQGGTLLIGVDDNKNILGLKTDYETLKKKNSDGFIVNLTQMINHYLGKEVHRYLSIYIEQFQEKEICLIRISPANAPSYVNHNDHQEFFIRTASSVQPMDVRDSHEYIISHWKKV